jgi:hypothetical protein
MQFKQIKADGTLYVANVYLTGFRIVRPVQVNRMWDYSSSLRSTQIRPGNALTPSKSRGDQRDRMWSSTHHWTGIFCLTAPNTTEGLEKLMAVDVTPFRKLTRAQGAEAVDALVPYLPEGLKIAVLLSRDFEDTYEGYLATQERKRQERQEKEAQFRRDQDKAANAEERVNRALAPYALREVYGKPPVSKRYVTFDADELAALLEKLDPQYVADAIADRVRDSFSTDDPKVERILHEIQGSANYVRQQIREEM